MTCPYCGFAMEEASAGPCPRCGRSVTANARESAGGGYGLPTDAFSASPEMLAHSSFPSSATPTGENFGFAYPSQSASASAPPIFVPLSPAPTRKKRTGLIISIVLGIVVVIASCLSISFTVLNTVFQQGPFSSVFTLRHPIPFQDALTSNINGWTEAEGQCFFQNNAYHIENGYTSFAPVVQVSDANITVQVRQLRGPLTQHYGIVFRHASDNNWYEFTLNSDTEWGFYKNRDGNEVAIVEDTINSAIDGNLNSTNTMRVQAKGSHFVFFVNGTQVGEVEDSTFASGGSGLFSGGYIEVAYNNFEITAA